MNTTEALRTIATPSRVVVVLGMHRSGTSALARGVSALGVNLGDGLLPADVHNPAGYWESMAITQINNDLFAAQGLAWDSACALRTSVHPGDPLVRQAREALQARFAGKALCGFKDPRASRLLWFWRHVFADLALDDSYVLALRHPEEVVGSLQAREPMPRIQALVLWALHYLDALPATASRRRAIVDYDALLADPEKQMRRIAQALDLPLDASRRAAIARYGRDFIAPQLRHHRDQQAGQDDDPVTRSVLDMYDALRAAASGECALESAQVADALGEVRGTIATLEPLLVQAARGAALAATAQGIDGTWAARIEPRMPPTLVAGDWVYVEVVCTNEGTRTWPAASPGATVNLGYHIRDRVGRVLMWDNERIALPHPVPPGATVRLQAMFRASYTPSDYMVEWDMVSEGECWFQERGSMTATVPLRVTATGQADARLPAEIIAVTPWSPRFGKRLEEIRVSIAVRAWNVMDGQRRAWFDATLASLKDAGHPYELFIVDNGSIDGSSELIASLGGHVVPRNAGGNSSGSGMNIAIERALSSQPDLIVFSDDDIAWHPGFLRRAVEFWSHSPPDLALLSGFIEPRWPWNAVRGVVHCGPLRTIIRESAPGGAWTFPAANWRWIGPLDPGMSADYDACMRLRRAGFRIGQADLALHMGAGFSTWGNKPLPGAALEDALFGEDVHAGSVG
jgi:hypothetical protein